MRTQLRVTLMVDHDRPWRQPEDDGQLTMALEGLSVGPTGDTKIIDEVDEIEQTGFTEGEVEARLAQEQP